MKQFLTICTLGMTMLFIASVSAENNTNGYISGGWVMDSNQKFHDDSRVVSETIRFVTAYNAGDPSQNWGDPCISASGENLCNALDMGKRRCAANFVPLGTQLHIENYGPCMVTDRTNRRYRNRVDIAMKRHEIKQALQFGKRKLKVKILKSSKAEFPTPQTDLLMTSSVTP